MKRILTTISLVTVLAVATSLAQPGGRMGMGMGGAPGVNGAMTKFFGNNTSFTATAEFTMRDSSSGPMSMEMNMSMLDGKMRTELDMTKIKSDKMSPNAAASLKQMGMDKTVQLVRPDKKMTYTVFPGLQAYAQTAMSDKEVTEAGQEYKLEKTSLGKETIDGHSCEKNKVVATNDKGEKHEVTVWNATDLKDFPIQMQMPGENGEGTILMKFKDVKLAKPDAKLFEPPAEFTKYDSREKLMQTEVMKRVSAGGFGAPPK